MAADKYIALVAGQLTNTSAVQSGGAGNAGKLVALNDTTGLLDVSTMPAGIGTVDNFTANVGTTTVANGDLVYLTSGGVWELAVGSAIGTIAQGYALVGDTTGNPITVYFDGANTAVSGLTVGAEYYLDPTTPGKLTATAPSTPGQIVQPVGFAVTATRLHFNRQKAVVV